MPLALKAAPAAVPSVPLGKELPIAKWLLGIIEAPHLNWVEAAAATSLCRGCDEAGRADTMPVLSTPIMVMSFRVFMVSSISSWSSAGPTEVGLDQARVEDLLQEAGRNDPGGSR